MFCQFVFSGNNADRRLVDEDTIRRRDNVTLRGIKSLKAVW